MHCTAGTNGCGKSTLIKAIAGVYQPDDGSRITIDGQTFGRLSPDQARAFGIQVIYGICRCFPT